MLASWTFYILAVCFWLYQLPFHILMAAIVGALYLAQKPRFALRQHKKFVILVPAHNEQLGIEDTLQSLKQLDYPQQLFEIVVIADNCQDQTAEHARRQGVTVLERQDPERKSKGFALEFGVAFLKARQADIDAVVVVDADTRVDPLLLQAFAARLEAGQEWIQAYYSVSNAEQSVRTRLMTYAFALFNGCWLWGQDRLGLSCALRGNGMCLSWQALQRCPWQAYGLAEDLEFSWLLRSKGERVYFADEVRVLGEIFPDRGKAAESQQLRWEHGRKQLRGNYGAGIGQFPLTPWRKYLVRADLWMPPLSRYVSLVLISLLAGILSLALRPEGGMGLPAVASLGVILGEAVLVLGLYLLAPFVQLQLSTRFMKAIFYAPFYMLWKTKLLGTSAPESWNRTQRVDKVEGEAANKERKS